MSVVLEFAPKVKIPELGAPWEGSLKCGAVDFSGAVAGAPNLKVNEKPGFVSFGASLCATAGGLVDLPGDRVGFNRSELNSFGPSVELAAPNSTNGVSEELPNENIDGVDPFSSKLTVARLGSVVEAVEGVGASVETGAGL